MDLALINKAIAAYKPSMSENDRKRLEFFRGLWELQQGYVLKVGSALDYDPPSAEQFLSWYWSEKPLFMMLPLTINKDLFLAAIKDCNAYIVHNAGLSKAAASLLSRFDWDGLINRIGLEDAGYDPSAWQTAALELAAALCKDDPLTANTDTVDYGALGIVLNCALRPMLEPAAMLALTMCTPNKESYENHTKPLRCPICGGLASLCFVGNTPSSDGVGHMLFCTTCSANWEFERIRCGRCGTQNQSKLHYFHAEDDPAHRLYLCDECGSYLRTTYMPELKAPFCMEVEDVIMARLDYIATNVSIKSDRIDQ